MAQVQTLGGGFIEIPDGMLGITSSEPEEVVRAREVENQRQNAVRVWQDFQRHQAAGGDITNFPEANVLNTFHPDGTPRTPSPDGFFDGPGPILGAMGLSMGLNSLLGGAGSASAGASAPALGASESFVGPATGTVLQPGLQASGAIASAAPGVAAPAVIGATGGIADTITRILSGTAGSSSAGGSAAGAATSAAAGTAVSRILNGTATEADWSSVLGPLAGAGIGAYASSQQADAIREIADRSRADRLPFLDTAKAYLADPQAYADGPGASALNAVLRKLSVNGNPANDPGLLATATEAALRDWRSAVTGMANLGLAGEDTRSNLEMQATGADANFYNSIGSGVSTVLNPPKSLSDILKELKTATNGASLSLQ